MKKKKELLFDNRALFRLILPLIIEQILSVVIGMTDSIVVAHVGEAAVSGVSLVDQIMVLMIQVFAALATGGAVIAGQYLGQKRPKEASKASTQLLYFIGVIALAVTIILYILQDVLLKNIFGHIDADVMTNARTYYSIVTASIPFIAIYSGGAAIFRAMGNSKVTMYIAVLMNIVNFGGDMSLVFLADMGTAGVGIPTLVSRAMAAIIVVFLLLDQKRLLHIRPTIHIRFDWTMIRSILRIGIPNGVENSMFQLGKIMVLSLVSTFGTSAIAANAVSNALATFQILPGNAMSLAMVAVVSQCIGAGDYKQAKHYNRKILGISYISVAVTTALTMLALPLFMRAYNLTARTAATAQNIMFWHAVFAVTIWSMSFVLPATFRAAGDAKFCMYVAAFSMWVFRIGCSFLFAKYLGMGVLGVWFSMFVDWGFRSVCFVVHYLRGKWMGQKVLAE